MKPENSQSWAEELKPGARGHWGKSREQNYPREQEDYHKRIDITISPPKVGIFANKKLTGLSADMISSAHC